jgi:hypothetical protein
MTDEDDDLLDRLRQVAAEADPVPDVVAASARAAFETRRLDEELLELLHDSDVNAGALTRGPGDGPRLLSYEWGDVSLELQLRSTQDGVAVRGVVVGASAAVRLEPFGAEAVDTTIDGAGWFAATLPVVPFRVRVTAESGTPASTGWISP